MHYHQHFAMYIKWYIYYFEFIKGANEDYSDNNTHKIYIMTPKDQMSQLLSYFSGPNTSGAENY